MQKKLNQKLTLSRETLRHLTPREIEGAQGGGITATTIRSNETDSTCGSYVAACMDSHLCPPTWSIWVGCG